MENVSEQIIEFVNSEYSKKILFDLSHIIEMYGGRGITQSIDVYDGCDVSYYYNPYITNYNPARDVLSETYKNYLNTLYEKIIDSDYFFADDGCTELDDDIRYVNINIELDFEEKKIHLNGYGIKTIPEYSTFEYDLPEEMNNEITNYINNGITKIKIDFSGGGDSGQIDNFYDQEDNQIDENSLFEDIVYDKLSSEYPGWENNEGGQGDFLFDLVERKIYLNFGLNTEFQVDFPEEFEWSIDLNFI